MNPRMKYIVVSVNVDKCTPNKLLMKELNLQLLGSIGK